MFVHAGRKTGTPHEATAMVLRFDETTKEAVICSHGDRTPTGYATSALARHYASQIGRESFVPEQRFLTEDEAFAVGIEFRREHPWETPPHREGARLGRPAIRSGHSRVRACKAIRGVQPQPEGKRRRYFPHRQRAVKPG